MLKNTNVFLGARLLYMLKNTNIFLGARLLYILSAFYLTPLTNCHLDRSAKRVVERSLALKWRLKRKHFAFNHQRYHVLSACILQFSGK